MKYEPLVSVIITTYKRSEMIVRAINSVLNQSYKNIEVVVVDDNNPDTEYRKLTEEKLDIFKGNDKVKYIKHSKNMNGAAARNTGIKASDGEIICFLDDDDWYYNNKVELQVKFLIENKDYQAVYCGWKRENKNVIPKFEGDVSFELLNGDALIYTNTIMVWKYAAINCGGWDEEFKRNQEAVFLLRFFYAGYKIGVVDKVLVEFDVSDRSNALDAKGKHEQMDLYINKHEYIINKIKKNNAKKIILSYRYRGILLDYIKAKEVKNAFKLYIKMTKKMPIRYNKDLITYAINYKNIS